MNKNILPEIEVNRPSKFKDERGEIWTTYEKYAFKNDMNINHTKYSTSRKGVIRGFHGDFHTFKIVSCIYGELFFAVVDNRRESKTYFQYDYMNLDDKNRDVVLVPLGFGNAFCVLSDLAIFSYVLSYEDEYIDAQNQFTIKWNNPNIGVKWPINNPILSERDL